MKIIYGGSFNPPTIAHKKAYYFLDEKMHFDEFEYLPVSDKYSKNGLIKDIHRINMLNLMIKDMPKANVSLKECESDKYLGTYHILKDEPDDTYFLIGSDNLKDIDKWINHDILIKERKFIVLSRNGNDDLSFINNNELLKKYKSNFIIFDDFNVPVSSSLFRNNKDYSILPDEIEEYIKKYNLYEEKLYVQ